MTKPKRSAFVYTARQASARHCPACARVLDASTGVSVDPADPRPEPAIGDVTACAYCGAILVYVEAGFRLADAADLAALDPDLRRLVLEFSASKTNHRSH